MTNKKIIKEQASEETSLVEFKKIDGHKIPATTSLKIAEVFGKRHDHVLRDVENLLTSGKLGRPNFGESSYRNDQNKKMKMFLLDELLTSLLIMGFTGDKALDWKIAYAKEFQRMRSVVHRSKGDTLATMNSMLNETLKDKRAEIGKATSFFHYANIAKLVNEIATGDSDFKRDELIDTEYDHFFWVIRKTILGIAKGFIHYDNLKPYLMNYFPTPFIKNNLVAVI